MNNTFFKGEYLMKFLIRFHPQAQSAAFYENGMRSRENQGNNVSLLIDRVFKGTLP
jgi:hypothetical protein